MARTLLPAHISYSAMADWGKCPKQYQLSRVLGLPETPAWWNVGGHAVHAATEAFDRIVHSATGA